MKTNKKLMQEILTPEEQSDLIKEVKVKRKLKKKTKSKNVKDKKRDKKSKIIMREEKKILPVNFSYRDLCCKYAVNELDSLVKNKIYDSIEKVFNKETSDTIQNLLESKVLEIVSPETFFQSRHYVDEIDTIFFNSNLSINNYLRNTIMEIKRYVGSGASNITLTTFLFNIALYLKKANLSKESLNQLMDTFVLSTCFIFNNPVRIRILNKRLLKIACKKFDVECEYYQTVVDSLFNSFDNLATCVQKNSMRTPGLELVSSVYNTLRPNKFLAISKLLDIPLSVVEDAFKQNIDMFKKSCEVEVILKYLQSLSKKEVGLSEIYEVINSYPIYYFKETLYAFSKEEKETHKSYYKLIHRNMHRKMYSIYLDEAFFEGSLCGSLSSTIINCPEKVNTEMLLDLIECAHRVNMVRLRVTRRGNVPKTTLKIIIKEMKTYSTEVIKALENKRRELIDRNNVNVVLEITYKSGPVSLKDNSKEPNFYIVSDLHEDINKKSVEDINFGNRFVINCGDTSGNATQALEWLKPRMSQGILVKGNHLGYSSSNTIEDDIQLIKENLNKDNSNIKLLENESLIINGVLFIGCCLYTDFCLYGKENQESAMKVAQYYINDFKYILKKDNENKVLITPQDYVDRFNESKNYILKETLKYANLPAVIITHFAPFPHSIAPQYKGDPLSPFFASDLTDVIERRPNIRLWCHGHVHQKVDYIYKGVRVIANPYGYYFENNIDNTKYTKSVWFKSIKSPLKWNVVHAGLKTVR